MLACSARNGAASGRKVPRAPAKADSAPAKAVLLVKMDLDSFMFLLVEFGVDAPDYFVNVLKFLFRRSPVNLQHSHPFLIGS